MTVFLALKVFFQSQKGINVHLFVENMTIVVYLSKRGEGGGEGREAIPRFFQI